MTDLAEKNEDQTLTAEHWQPLRDQIAEALGVDPADLYPHPSEEEK